MNEPFLIRLYEYLDGLSKLPGEFHESDSFRRLNRLTDAIEKELGTSEPKCGSTDGDVDNSKVTFHESGLITIEPKKSKGHVNNLPHGW